MNLRHLVSCLAFILSSAAFAQPTTSAPQAAPLSKPSTPQLADNFGKLPLSFEANRGQAGSQVKFLSAGNGYSLALTTKAAVLTLTRNEPPKSGRSANKRLVSCRGGMSKGLVISTEPKRSEETCGFNDLRSRAIAQSAPNETDVVTMEIAEASQTAQITGTEQLPGTANYFIGSDPAKWLSDIPTYAKVKYQDVYPGIDLVYYGNQRQLEYDFIVQPKADPSQARLRFAGAEKLKLSSNGDLAIIARSGQIAFHKPVVYQMRNGHRQPIKGRFALLANNTVGFELGAYDRSRELVIDPILAYSTYLDASTSYSTAALAVDWAGNAYVTGFYSYGDQHGSVYVAKLNPEGSALLYFAHFGGTADDFSSGIAVDRGGNAYVTGFAQSIDYPVTANAFQKRNKAVNGFPNGFVTKLNPAGSALVYSTYLGGSYVDSADAIALDSEGDAYVTGSALSADFPVTAKAFQRTNRAQGQHSGNAFISKLNPEGSSLIYSTYLGGTGADVGQAIAVDCEGDAYVAGYTQSKNFPVTETAFQKVNKSVNAFVAKIDPDGSALDYATYLGGSILDSASAIAVDFEKNAYVAGSSLSTDFPVTGAAYQKINKAAANFGPNAFVTKLNPDGSSPVYSTYLGGRGGIGGNGDSASGIALDSGGNAYLTGTAVSTNFPVTLGAFQTGNNAATLQATNAFFTVLNSKGGGLAYSTYLGGSGSTGYSDAPFTFGDSGLAIARDGSGNVYLAGDAGSTNFPVTNGAFLKLNKSDTINGGTAPFVAKFAMLKCDATVTTLASDGNPQILGVKITFTAHVAAEGDNPPSGKVAFSIDGGQPIEAALDDTGHATYSTATLAAGTHTIAVRYSGSAQFAASSATISQTTCLPGPGAPGIPASR